MSRGRMRELKGVVIKNSSDKTVTVQTETSNKNRIYNKIVHNNNFICLLYTSDAADD